MPEKYTKIQNSKSFSFLNAHMRLQSVGGGGTEGLDPPPLKNHKNIGFLSNTGSDRLKNHEATKPVFNVGPSLAHQGNTI